MKPMESDALDCRAREEIQISAVIPVYNREKTIARAIESVLAQEYPPAEIIVIDDGSKDATREIVQKYGDKVRYVYQDNAGVAAARNRGVSEAKFGWIAFLDSDDYWLPHHLKHIVYAMHATEEKAVLYFSDIEHNINEKGGSYWDFCGFSISGRYEFRQDASRYALGLRRQPMMLQASVIQRQIYIEAGIPKALVTREDTFFFYRVCLFYPACAVSGIGTVMSSDDDRGGRLTVALDSKTPRYHDCTILLYKELWRYNNMMNPDQRKIIEESFVRAHLDYSRLFLKKKQFFNAMKKVLGGFKINTLVALKWIIKDLKSYVLKRL